VAITRSTASAFPVDTNGTAVVTTPSVTLGAAGDLVVLDVYISGTQTVTSVSNTSSALTWTRAGGFNSSSSHRLETWTAVVTSAAAGQTCTITVTPSSSLSGRFTELVVDDLISGFGSSVAWSTSGFAGVTDASSTTVTWPAINTPPSGVLAYHGYAGLAQPLTGGTSPIGGVTFTYTILGANADGLVFSGALAASTSYTPLGTQSPAGTSENTGVIISAAAATDTGQFLPFL
jgi:hypothetical protein